MKNMTIEQFAMQTASNEPVPGGGSISALAGALAAALTEMVAGLTIGKKKYAEVEEEMKAAVEPMHKICEQLLVDIKRDSESFDLYMQAWKSGCKGTTIFRNNCARIPILSTSEKKEESKELPRGEIIKAGDNCIGLKRTLMTGCGSLHL